ncbi:MAG: PAS domain S-box protein, partial [Candidatus Humimicrobiaceae bacterium]
MYKITDLKEIERLFRLITENITDTVWITDLNLKIKYISPSVTKLLGFTLEELQSMPIEQNITPKSCKKVLDTIKKV